MHLGLEGYLPLVLYVAAIVVFFLSIFWKPQVGMYFLVPLLPMQTIRYLIHQYPLGEKFVDVLLLGVLIGLLVQRERPIFVSSPMNKVLVIFIALTYFSLWQGAFFLGGAWPISIFDPRFSEWKNYVEMMVLFFVTAAAIRTPKQMRVLIILMILSVLMVNKNFHNTVGGRDFSQYSDDLRYTGVLGYAGTNGMGAFQAEFAVFLIGLAAFTKRRIVKVGLWAAAFTSVYCLLFTFSRGGYLGLLVGILVVGLIKERKLLAVLAAILLSWQMLVPNAVRERVEMTYQDGQGLDNSAQIRVQLWQDALDVITHEPVLGTGFDTYRYMGRFEYFTDTHNYYVKVLLEMGFVGLLIFLWVLATASMIAWRLARDAKDPILSQLGCAFFSMLMCAIVVNFFGDRWSLLQVNGFLWVLMGLAARALVMVRQEQEVPDMGGDFSLAASSTPGVSHA